MQAQLERKRKSEEEVLAYLNRAIRREEEEIEQWTTRIENLQARAEIEAELSLSLPASYSLREGSGQLEEERRAGLKTSIQKLKDYISKNQQYLMQ